VCELTFNNLYIKNYCLVFLLISTLSGRVRRWETGRWQRKRPAVRELAPARSLLRKKNQIFGAARFRKFRTPLSKFLIFVCAWYWSVASCPWRFKVESVHGRTLQVQTWDQKPQLLANVPLWAANGPKRSEGHQSHVWYFSFLMLHSFHFSASFFS